MKEEGTERGGDGRMSRKKEEMDVRRDVKWREWKE